MTNTVLIKRSGTANAIPTAGQLTFGELAINYNDGNLFYKGAGGAVTLLTSNQFVSVAGNVTGGNINTGGRVSATANVTGGNILTGGIVSAAGIVSGVELTSTNASGSEGGQINLAAAPSGTLSGTSVTIDIYNNQLRFFEQGGSARGAYIDLSAAAAGVGSNLLAGGSSSTPTQIVNGTSNVSVTSSGNITANVAGAWVASFYGAGMIANSFWANNNNTGQNFRVGDDAWIGDINTADTMSVRGQQNAANGYIVFGNADNTQLGRAGSGPLTYGGAFSATGNITGGNLIGTHVGNLTGTTVSVTGNITGGNLLTAGLISTSANISGNNIQAGNVLANGTMSSTGAVTAGTFATAGLVTATGNVTGGNILTPGIISATGNVTGNYFIGNGSQLTGISTSATKIFNGTSEANIGTSGGNANITIGGVSNVAVFTTTGLNITGNISATGNISSGLFYGGGNMGLDTEAVTQTFNFGNITDAVDLVYQLNVVTAPTDAINGVNIIDNTITGAKLVTGVALPTPNIGVATGTSLSVTGNVTAGGLTAPTASVTGTVYADKITTVSIPQVLNDISNQCDGAKMVFPLQVDQSNITSANITESKNLQVTINGAVLSPWVNTQTWPWFQTFAGFPLRSPGYQVIATATSANITFYRSPAQGSQVVLTIINNSSTAQLRKYPYSATTIALGD